VAASGARLDVLRDVTFSLRPGEVGAFVGPSGCGKTTMLRIIAGLDTAYEGAIRHLAKGTVGMVFQEPRCCPGGRRGRQRAAHCARADEKKLATLFEVLELARTAPTSPASYRSASPGAWPSARPLP